LGGLNIGRRSERRPAQNGVTSEAGFFNVSESLHGLLPLFDP
jgi:hypothetical protein